MARLDQGLLGGYSGKLGTTVGASWKGINVVRTYQPTVANPNTQKQRNHRVLFSEWVNAASFLLASHIKPLWDKKAKKMSGYNAFIQANLNNPRENGIFAPEVMILSDGIMGTTPFAVSTLSEDGEILLQWDEDDLPLYGSDTDRIYIVVFNYVGEIIGTYVGDEIRMQGSLDFTLQYARAQTEAIVVIAWQSDDGRVQSTTQHLELTVS